ncbi:MAG: M20/M25/M40 family metallo-hydrolase [Candidatus Levybacteria bacterium]|nr:M20/M25/M40 family metallo-hydrolase [Candidatus Levybacteria bacterium]
MTTQALLEKLVSIPSPLNHEKEIGEYLFAYLTEIGFHVEKVCTDKNRVNLVATFGVAKTYLGFYGHMDTVSPESDQETPYQVIRKDNIVKGLGVEDMKGGIAAMLQAGTYAVANNLPVKLIFGVDEEGISQGAHDLVDSALLKDIGFLIVGESGQIDDYTQDFSVCYGRKGRMLFEVNITGKKAHAAESERGINAIEQAARFVALLQNEQFQPHSHLGKTRIVLHTMHSETDSFSVPDKATIFFSFLTTPNIDSKKFLKDILQKAKEQDIHVEIKPFKRKTPYGESYEVDQQNTFLQNIEKNIFYLYSCHPIYATSVADENVFANRLEIPVISIGPVGGGGHTRDEWLDLNSLEKVVDVYKKSISLYNKS